MKITSPPHASPPMSSGAAAVVVVADGGEERTAVDASPPSPLSDDQLKKALPNVAPVLADTHPAVESDDHALESADPEPVACEVPEDEFPLSECMPTIRCLEERLNHISLYALAVSIALDEHLQMSADP